jgi:ABC-type transport system involved in multi-copper enzyme maturation permease subunit
MTSTTVTAGYGDTLDLSESTRIPMSRLVKVELRKMVDTRAGMWLMIAIGVITVAAVVIFGLAADEKDRTFGNFMGFTGTPQGFLLPVMGILLVTQEWSQRTAMVTFTLEPHRSRTLAAKVYAALLLGLAAILLAMVVAAFATVVFGGGHGFDDVQAIDFAKFAILQVSGVLQGLAFGLLFLNSAAAIVTYFVLPTVFSIIANVWSFLSDKAAWIDFGTAQNPLFNPGELSGKEWAQLAVTGTAWVILPFVVGLWRMLRAEVK